MDNLVVAGSLEAQLARINDLRTQMEQVTEQIQGLDAGAMDETARIYDEQEVEIARTLGPAEESLEAYVRKCKEKKTLAEQASGLAARPSTPTTPEPSSSPSGGGFGALGLEKFKYPKFCPQRTVATARNDTKIVDTISLFQVHSAPAQCM